MSKDFLSVSDNRYLDKTIGTANRNRSHEVYDHGKPKRAQQIDLVFENVKTELLDDLFEADTQSDIFELLHASICYTINHYKFNLEPEDVLPYFWKAYGLKDTF